MTESLCLYGEEYSHPIFLRKEGDYCFPFAAYEKKLRSLVARNADDRLFLATAAVAGAKPAVEVFDWFQRVSVFNMQSDSLRSNMIPILIARIQADKDHSMKEFLCTLLHEADIDICDYFLVGEGDTAELRLVHNVVERLYVDEKVDASLRLEDESEGTINLLLLGIMLEWAFEEGRTLFLDNFDTHFHPLLVCHLVRLFQDPEINRANAQLILSARMTELLSPRVLRRDEIYFVDKDRNTGASHCYSLQEIEPTSRKDIRKAYLAGRYGAVPNVVNNPVLVYRKSGQSETVNPVKRNRPFSIENGCAVLGTRELPFLEWQLPFA